MKSSWKTKTQTNDDDACSMETSEASLVARASRTMVFSVCTPRYTTRMTTRRTTTKRSAARVKDSTERTSAEDSNDSIAIFAGTTSRRL